MAKLNITEFIDIFTKNDGRYDKLDDTVKSSFYFIFNRLMYYKFPTSANFFNKKEINTARVMDFWRIFLINSNAKTKGYDVKNWIYSALKSNSQIRKKKDGWYPNDNKVLFEYLKRYHMSLKDFNNHIEFNLNELKSSYNEFVKYYEANTK